MDEEKSSQKLADAYEPAITLLVLSLSLDMPPSLQQAKMDDEMSNSSLLWKVFIQGLKSSATAADLGYIMAESALTYNGNNFYKTYK